MARKDFNCLRCGQCCRLKLRLYPDDVRKIKTAGHKNFLDGKYMRQINGYCMFLKLDNGIATCKLQDTKPQVCQKFPRCKLFKIPFMDQRCYFYRK